MNKTKHKFAFTIHIKSIIHPPTEAVLEGAPTSVAFQRGPKLAITKEIKLGPAGCEIDESLVLLVTLYRGKTNFEEKKGKLWVRQTKMSKSGSEIHQGIGICEFNLSDYVAVGNVGVEAQFDLVHASTENAKIVCNISSTTVASSTDETLSTFSAMSSVSAQGAVFENDVTFGSSSPPVGQLNDLAAISEGHAEDDALLREIDDLDPENNASSSGSADVWKKKYLEEARYQRGIESQLINCKLEVAELKTAMDQKHKENMDLRKVVTKYASEIGKMEVKQLKPRRKSLFS